MIRCGRVGRGAAAAPLEGAAMSQAATPAAASLAFGLSAPGAAVPLVAPLPSSGGSGRLHSDGGAPKGGAGAAGAVPADAVPEKALCLAFMPVLCRTDDPPRLRDQRAASGR